MGRPETPVDRTLVACGRLADLLRAARRAAGLTYGVLAARTGVSAATLKRAASGRTIPSHATIEKFLTACGAAPEELARAGSLRREARREQRGPVEATVPVARISTRAELCAALVSLHREAGSPPYRHMQARADSIWLALSSLSRILNHRTVPNSRGQMSAFLRGCGASEEQQEHWLTAWERVTRPYRAPGAHLRPATALNPEVVLRLTTRLGGSRTLRPSPVPAWRRRAQWGREALYLVIGSEGIDTPTLARRAGLPVEVAAHLLEWLRRQQLVVTVAGVHHPGPAMTTATRPGSGRALFDGAMVRLRDELGAAVYFSRYLDGEVVVQACADSATAPRVPEWVSFKEAAHASAVGKSLLVQLDATSRMDHLTRHPAVTLTDRTITTPRLLFDDLDRHGPYAAQFSRLEYSPGHVCAAMPLGLPGSTAGIALSLPVRDARRLEPAAAVLGKHADGLLLSLMLAADGSGGGGVTPRRSGPG
ncbi:helix-turn-helix domain-containing protein [Streptomyces sp. NPDC023588]|uniref:helix-turn-helix domain-containing protein n=1 Tax=Streptomyces sp. NPDC023588 TaxID=3154907 RepID=UPI0033C5B930